MEGGVTAVIHLAAVAHRIGSRRNLDDAIYDQVNHLGTARLAAAVRASGSIRRMVFVSSIGAVASLAEEPLSELSPCRPDTPYGRSKLAAEHAITAAFAGSPVEWTILRPPLIYGAGNPGNMERLLRLIKLPVPLPLGSLRNRRTFLYVGNLVDAIVLGLTHPAAANRLFCLGDNEELSTPDLMRRLGRAANCSVRLFPFPLRGLRLVGWAGTTVSRIVGRSPGFDLATIEKLCGSLRVDSSLFRRECKWQPPFSLEDGLRATVANLL